MQQSEAGELRTAWGSKPCTHRQVVKEYYLASQTGDRVCTTCGTTWADTKQAEAARNAALLRYGEEQPSDISDVADDKTPAG